MPTYIIEQTEQYRVEKTYTVEADSEEEALDRVADGDYDDYEETDLHSEVVVSHPPRRLN